MRFQWISCFVISLLLTLHAEECLAVEPQPADLPGLDSVSAGCIFCKFVKRKALWEKSITLF